MRIQKILSVLLSLVIGIVTLGAVPVSARSSNVGYVISGAEESGEFVLHVSLRNVLGMGGRLAIAFDNEKLEMPDTSALTNAVKASNNVSVTTEGLDSSVLLSNEKGYAMFAWYASSNTGIDALSSDTEIATIPLRLKNGASTADFSRNTIGLYYVNDTMAHKWDCSAKIVTNNLIAYRNNDISDKYLCNIDYDYPNCDYVPIVTYEAGVHVTDRAGNPLIANVILDNLEAETDSSGYTSFQMENGVYAYRVSANGYETKSGYLIIQDGDATVNAQLMSYAELAQETANSIAIVYAEGDSADSVTSNLVLPSEGENGEEITWQSSNDSVISSQGAVTRGENDMRVTLTATVSLGTSSARRSFEVNVKSRFSAEEKNAQLVARDKAALNIQYAPGDSRDSVTSNLKLTEVGLLGSAILWSSSREDIITEYGEVIRPSTDVQVKLTALIFRTGAQDTKEFTVTVKGANKGTLSTDQETVDKVLSALTVGYSDGDSEKSVTNQLTLAIEGAEGTEIEWTSSHPAVVTAYGGVVRQVQDVSVTLTATVRKGNASASKTFTVLVKAAPAIPENPDNGQEEDIRKQNGIDVGSNGSDLPTPTPTAAPEVTPTPTTTPDTANERFTDIDSVPWAKEAILSLAQRGVISGTSDTTYSPQNPIRRADFIMLLTRMLNLDGEITESFDDVPNNKYYYESVALAKSLDIISGVGDNKFNPEGSITRQDMMVMTYRALSKLNMANMNTADLSVFADSASVASYARESVAHLVGGGYISGDNGRLNPVANTTRAETAVFLYKLDKDL